MSIYVCPHFDWKNKERIELLNILFSKVADARRHDPGMFRFTHAQMNLLKGSSGSVEVSESEIIENILRYRTGNHVTLITGNTGTGKSEMCSAIYIALTEMDKEVLYLGRAASLSAILADEIPKFYRRCVGDSFPEEEKSDDFRKILEHPQNAGEFVASAMIIKHSLQDFFNKNESTKSDFIEYVSRKMGNILLKEGTDTDVFAGNDLGNYPQKQWAVKFNEDLNMDWDELADEMNRELWGFLYRIFESLDLTQMMMTLNENAPQERIYIIFEDYAFSRTDSRDFLSFLESDSPDNKLEVIIAGLQERINPIMSQTMADRFDVYRTQTPGGEVTFLNENNAVEFARPFLVYPKTIDNSISEKNERSRSDINSLCSNCRKKEICKPEMRPLFPFTENFLIKLYKGLDIKSPRRYIMAILEALQEYSKGVPLSSSRNLKVMKQQDYYDDIEDEIARYFFVWYGSVNNYQKTWPEEIAELMGVNTSDINVTIEEGENGEEIDEEKDNIPDELQEYIDYIPNWIIAPLDDRWKNTKDYIERGAHYAIHEMTEGFKIAGGPLQVGYGKGELSVVTLGKSPKVNQIVLEPANLRKGQAVALLKFGYISEQKRKDPKLFESLLNPYMGLIFDWFDKWQEQMGLYIDSISIRVHGHDPMPLKKIPLQAFSICCLLNNPWKEIDYEYIQQRLNSKVEFNIREWLKREINEDTILEIEEILKNENLILEWIHSYYGAGKDYFDKMRVEDELNSLGHPTILKELYDTEIRNIRDRRIVNRNGEHLSGPVKIMIEDEELKTFLLRLKRVVNNLISASDTKDLDRIIDHVGLFNDAYGGVSPKEVESGIKRMLSNRPSSGNDKAILEEVIEVVEDPGIYERVVNAFRKMSVLAKENDEDSRVLLWLMWSFAERDRGEDAVAYRSLREFRNTIAKSQENGELSNEIVEKIDFLLNLFSEVW